MYRLTGKKYLKFFFIVSTVYLLLITIFKGQKGSEFDTTTISSFQIISHNFVLFLKWQFLFILSPIYFIFETLVLSWTIKIGIITFGLLPAIDKLWRHGLIEIPNLFLYQFLALRLFYYWWKNKSFVIIKEYVNENKKNYLLSMLLIVGAGIVEGIAW